MSDDDPPFQLATPPGFQVKHIPKGKFVCTCTSKCFFCTLDTVSPAAADLTSRSRMRGMQVGRVYTASQAWSPAELRDACSGRLKSRKSAKKH